MIGSLDRVGICFIITPGDRCSIFVTEYLFFQDRLLPFTAETMLGARAVND